MATKLDDKCLQKASDDEPLFILRGQDKSSPKHVLGWIIDNFENVNDDKLREAFELAIRMKHFRYRKVAD